MYTAVMVALIGPSAWLVVSGGLRFFAGAGPGTA